MVIVGGHLPHQRPGPRLRDHLRRREPGDALPMVATVGVLVAANLFLVLQLSHPYVGEMATSPEPLREVIRVADS